MIKKSCRPQVYLVMGLLVLKSKVCYPVQCCNVIQSHISNTHMHTNTIVMHLDIKEQHSYICFI